MRALAKLRAAQSVPSIPRVASCRRHVAARITTVQCVTTEYGPTFRGTARCDSPWACPYCTPFHGRQVGERLADTLDALFRARHHVLFVTLTSRHRVDDSLAWQIDRMTRARRSLFNTRAWRTIAAGADFKGTVRAWEVTDGASGWHAHTHEFLVFGHHPPRLVDWYPGAWAQACKSQGLYASKSFGTQVAYVDPMSSTQAAYYATSWGPSDELVNSPYKTAKGGNRTVWDDLDAAIAGNELALERWQEYALATQGRKRLSWSGALKGLIAAKRPKPPDTAVDVDGIDFTPEGWSVAVRRGLDIRVQQLVAAGDLAAAFNLVQTSERQALREIQKARATGAA